jgi:hypothetical protein
MEQSGAVRTIRLEGVVDIGCAAELKETLVAALAAGGETHVLLEPGTALDVTAVQLLWAAERAARAAELPWALEGRAPEAVAAMVREAGFERFPLEEGMQTSGVQA